MPKQLARLQDKKLRPEFFGHVWMCSIVQKLGCIELKTHRITNLSWNFQKEIKERAPISIEFLFYLKEVFIWFKVKQPSSKPRGWINKKYYNLQVTSLLHLERVRIVRAIAYSSYFEWFNTVKKKVEMEDIRVNQLPWQMNQSMRINKDRHNLSVEKAMIMEEI